MAFVPRPSLLHALRRLQATVPDHVQAQHSQPLYQYLNAADDLRRDQGHHFPGSPLPFSLQRVRSFSVNPAELPTSPKSQSQPLLSPQLVGLHLPALSHLPALQLPQQQQHSQGTHRAVGYLNTGGACVPLGLRQTSASAPSLLRGAAYGQRRPFAVQQLQQQRPLASSPPRGGPLFREIDLIPHRDWNEEFNQILESPLALRGHKLQQLSSAFVEVAERVARIIVRERCLPPSARSVRPLPDARGYAGGEKFRTKGIFFKYAVDQHGLYGGDDGAMKVAGHELKGHTALVSCGMMHGLKFGLMTVVDYRGFRLTATSVLPVAEHTLVYGSCDGGHTVLARVPAFNEAMAQCGKILNLKGHCAGVADVVQHLHGPCDLEGHVGTDGRWYVLDLARLFPPEAPSSQREPFLVRLLRPELVKRNAVPLSSDAFTLFGRDQAAIHNEEVRQATRFLLEVVVPRVAAKLSSADVASLRTRGPSAVSAWLLRELHCAGVNVRHLGRVRSSVHHEALRRAIATELAARVLKNELKAAMRKCTAVGDDAYRRLALDFFNKAFFAGTAVRQGPQWEAERLAAACHWATVKAKLCAAYEHALDERERAPQTDLRDLLDVHHLFVRLQELTGVRFHADLPLAELACFEAHHMEGIFARAKTMYAVPRIEADAAIELARTSSSPIDVRRALDTAREKYDACLSLKPDDHEVLANLGMAQSELAVLETNEQRKAHLFAAAHESFSSALALAPHDHNTMVMWSDAFMGQAICGMAQHLNCDALLSRALDLLTAAEEASPGCAHANIARVAALATASEGLQNAQPIDGSVPPLLL